MAVYPTICPTSERESRDTDPVLDAVDALRASGVAVAPIGEELERWQIGDMIFSDADVLRLAESRGLVEAGP